jgi:hypothetical protein
MPPSKHSLQVRLLSESTFSQFKLKLPFPQLHDAGLALPSGDLSCSGQSLQETVPSSSISQKLFSGHGVHVRFSPAANAPGLQMHEPLRPVDIPLVESQTQPSPDSELVLPGMQRLQRLPPSSS